MLCLPGFMLLFDFLAVFSGPDLFLVLAMLNSDRAWMFFFPLITTSNAKYNARSHLVRSSLRPPYCPRANWKLTCAVVYSLARGKSIIKVVLHDSEVFPLAVEIWVQVRQQIFRGQTVLTVIRFLLIFRCAQNSFSLFTRSRWISFSSCHPWDKPIEHTVKTRV